MISNQILQNTIDGLKGITRIDLCVLDMEGQTLASTEAQPENFGGEVAALFHHRQTVRWFMDISFLRYLMKISWSTFYWQRDPVMTFIWWERWHPSS